MSLLHVQVSTRLMNVWLEIESTRRLRTKHNSNPKRKPIVICFNELITEITNHFTWLHHDASSGYLEAAAAFSSPVKIYDSLSSKSFVKFTDNICAYIAVPTTEESSSYINQLNRTTLYPMALNDYLQNIRYHSIRADGLNQIFHKTVCCACVHCMNGNMQIWTESSAGE